MARSSAKTKIIDVALDLMLRQGYPATTVDEICETAGVSKGSFYHAFESKEDMGLAALAAYFRDGVNTLMNGPFTASADPVQRAYGFLDHTQAIAAEHWRRGCLLAMFALDIGESDNRIRAEVRRLFAVLEDGLEAMFAPFGAQDGEQGRPMARDVAWHFLVVLEGSILMARAHGDPSMIAKGLAPFRKYLEGVAP